MQSLPWGDFRGVSGFLLKRETGLTLLRFRHLRGESDSVRRIEPGWLARRSAPEGLRQEQECAAYEATIGEVEDRPLELFVVPVKKVADAVKNDAVVEIAERAGQDQAERSTQRLVAGRGTAQAPIGNCSGGYHADHGKQYVGQVLVLTAQAEECAVVDARHLLAGTQR